jgi:iron-sulfur cluster assembly accessory protein
MAIHVTDNAHSHFLGLAREGKRFFKFGLRGGGCAGFSYTFDESNRNDVVNCSQQFVFGDEGDQSPDWTSFRYAIGVPGTAYFFLNGTTIDWVEDLMGSRFVFNSPKQTSACGCGESVSFEVE